MQEHAMIGTHSELPVRLEDLPLQFIDFLGAMRYRGGLTKVALC